MKKVTVLPIHFAGYFIISIDLLKKTSKTALFLLLWILPFTIVYSQSENTPTAADTSNLEQKQQQDSLNQLKQEKHTLQEDTANEVQLRKIRQRIETQKYWRGALVYSSIVLAIVLLISIFMLNYYQGRRKTK